MRYQMRRRARRRFSPERPSPTLRPPSDGPLRRDVQGALDELPAVVAAALRRHPHVNNVLTHISAGNWRDVECALHSIFDLTARASSINGLSANIIDLICADRGVSGRIMKPYFRKIIYSALPAPLAALILRHVAALYMEIAFELPGPIFGIPFELHRRRRSPAKQGTNVCSTRTLLSTELYQHRRTSES